MALVKTFLSSGSTIEDACFNFYENATPYYSDLAFTSNSGETIEFQMYVDENGEQNAIAAYYSNGNITRYYNSFSALCESHECIQSEYLLGCCDNKIYKLKSGKSLLVNTLVSFKPIYYCYRVINPPTWFPKYQILNDDMGFRIYNGSNSCDIMECQPCETYTANTQNTCEPITLLPLQLNCEVINPTEESPLSGVLDIAIVGGTQPYQIVWTLLDGKTITASTVYNQPEGTYTVNVTDRYGDFTASTQCKLEITYDCTFFGSAEEFIPIETSKCYSPSGISGCSGLIGSNDSGIDPQVVSFNVIVCECPQIYDSGSDCECSCINNGQFTQLFSLVGYTSPIGIPLYTSPSLDISTLFSGYFMTGTTINPGDSIYQATNPIPYCSIGDVLPCIDCGLGQSGTSGISGISGTVCNSINHRTLRLGTPVWSECASGAQCPSNPLLRTTRLTFIPGNQQEFWWCDTGGVNSGPGYQPLYLDSGLTQTYTGCYLVGSGGPIYCQGGLSLSYVGFQNEFKCCEPIYARVRPTVPLTPTPTPSPTPTPTLPLCTISLQFLKNCGCSRTSGVVLVDGITAYTWNTNTLTSFTSITASYGQTITIQGNVLTPAPGCSYFYSKLGISVTENLLVTYNTSIITGQNLISHSFPVSTCNTVLTINSSCQ